jgi:formylglycine-generating enzyme required for sulfatase activity
MSFDLVKAGKDRAFWDRLIRKYGKKIRKWGWQGPLEPEQLEIDMNSDAMDNVLNEALYEDGTEESFHESDGGGIPGSADFASITKLLGKFFVTGSYVCGGPYDDYWEAADKAGLSGGGRYDDGEDEDEKQAEYEDDVLRPVLPDPPGTITNSIGMRLVSIPAGNFMMGSPQKEKGSRDGEVQHKVTLTMDFYLGMTQVTQAQYEKVIGENPSCFQGDEVSGRDSSEFPVEKISWEDALKFCEKLSSLPDEKSAGRMYRLPTEAEWEYACRAGSNTAFFFGDDEESLSDYAWYYRNSGERPHPVALKKPNAWGLYDMHGNVHEWCSDWFAYHYPKGAVSDPAGPREGSSRVLRGGSWGVGALSCWSSSRSGSLFRPHENGFRVVLNSSTTP